MKRVLYVLILFSVVLLIAECDHSPKQVEDPASYVASVEKWQRERLEGLKSKNGWLNLAGIYWLKDGVQTFGSDSANDIVFPAKAPAFIGTLSLKDSLVYLEANDHVELIYKNEAVKELELTYDSSEEPSYITHGDFGWYIMKRHHNLAIRLRDYKHPALEALDHIPSYPIDPAYLVEAKLVPFEKVKTITVQTPFQDYTQDYQCPGELHFRLHGEKLTLLPFISGDTYFIIISDETSGSDTYGGGRFMYVQADSSGSVLLDFNKAYNPPCAVTAFAACPMPPRENHLPVKIEAGEKVVQVPGK
jgi:uncharacterized protein (DUF1684 family)